jgi:hypothetical protein
MQNHKNNDVHALSYEIINNFFEEDVDDIDLLENLNKVCVILYDIDDTVGVLLLLIPQYT